MNLLHRGFCASGFWSRIVSDRIAPWVLEGMDIGHTVLEIGAGPGAATAYLRTRASRLTCIDVDEPSATRLRNRMARHHVTVLCEDATATSFAGESFAEVVNVIVTVAPVRAVWQGRIVTLYPR